MYTVFFLLSLVSCTDKVLTDDSANDDSSPDIGHAEKGLPVGVSTWSGQGSVTGVSFIFSLELENDGGDLAGTLTVQDDPSAPIGFGTGVYSVSGTHEPGSGLVAFAPEEWITTANLEANLVGFSGRYDPETDALIGTIADYATDANNYTTGGPATLTRESGDGEPLDFGAMEKALPTGTRPYSGTQQCTGGQRELEGEVTYDGAGALSGTISFGDLTLAEGTHTFTFTGVHNPSTGGMTLVPGLYIETTDHSIKTFFVEATYDPATDRFDGEGRINIGSCPEDYWQAGF